MMSNEAGYAAALVKAALERGNMEPVLEDMSAVSELLTRFARFFSNPEVRVEDKVEFLKELLSGADPLTLELVVLLARRRCLKYWPGIRRRYEKAASAALGKITVRLSLPYEISAQLLKRLEEHLVGVGLYSVTPESTVRYEIVIDKHLIGGFIAEAEGRMLDMSLRKRLAALGHV